MNITRESNGEMTAILKVDVVKADYSESVEKVLREYRRKANIKGFRPGMVPMGMIKKMYGKAAMLDEINKTVSESIRKHLSDEKIEILGDPLPVSNENDKIDLDTQEDFTFSFELGLAPEVNLGLSKKNKVDYYEITVDEKMKSDYISNYARRFGEFRIVDETTDKELIKGSIAAIDSDGNKSEEGPAAEETSISINIIKDEEIKKLFEAKKIGDNIDFDLRKALPNDYEIAGILKKQKDDVKSVAGLFRFIVKEINRFEPAEVNQELFNKVYGEGSVNSEEEFNAKIEEEIKSNLSRESEYKLMLDLKALCLEKTDLKLPNEFLKKWLLSVNEETTQEQIDKEFDTFAKDLRWQLIRNKVAKDNEIKITEEELHDEAIKVTRYQFQQYGLYYATDEQLHGYAHEMLKREDDARRLAEKVLEEKALLVIKELVKLENKQVTSEEFNKLFE
jgi:trigger factor